MNPTFVMAPMLPIHCDECGQEMPKDWLGRYCEKCSCIKDLDSARDVIGETDELRLKRIRLIWAYLWKFEGWRSVRIYTSINSDWHGSSKRPYSLIGKKPTMTFFAIPDREIRPKVLPPVEKLICDFERRDVTVT